ncbi:MAG: nuclear transport factor 2 family protein, partial [Comamonadaceae bacterium]
MTKPTYVPEYQAIVGVLSKYIDGCKQARSDIMKPAFSEKATMFSISDDGKLAGGAIQALFEGIDSGFRPSPEAQSVI